MLKPYSPHVRWKLLKRGRFLLRESVLSFPLQFYTRKRELLGFFFISATEVLITLSFVCSELFFEEHFSLSLQLPNCRKFLSPVCYKNFVLGWGQTVIAIIILEPLRTCLFTTFPLWKYQANFSYSCPFSIIFVYLWFSTKTPSAHCT